MRNVAGWQNPDLRLDGSAIHGVGLFSSAPIHKGEIVLRMGGLIVRKAEFRDDVYCRYATVSIAEDDFLTRLLDGEKTQDDYINHSCSPNSWLKDEYTIIAKKQINPDDEITIDYAVWLDHPVYRPLGPCSCGNADCRIWITGQDWKRMDVVRNNYGHFMPYLNGFIERELGFLSSLRT